MFLSPLSLCSFLQLPIGAEDSFAGVVDLVTMQAIVWTGEELGARFEYREIPADLQEQAAEYRNILVETVVELVSVRSHGLGCRPNGSVALVLGTVFSAPPTLQKTAEKGTE